MKTINTMKQMNQHGHNAPWMIPIWGAIGFVGFSALASLGTGAGLLVCLIFTSALFTFLAKNKERMPITIRPDDFERYKNLRASEPEFYNSLKSDLSYFAKEIADFEYVEKARKEAELRSKFKKNPIDLHHRKRIKFAVLNQII